MDRCVEKRKRCRVNRKYIHNTFPHISNNLSMFSMSNMCKKFKRFTDGAFLATFDKPTELQSHPTLRAFPLIIAQRSFLVKNFSIQLPDFLSQSVQSVGLHTKILMLGSHFAQFLFCSLCRGTDTLSSTTEIIEGFFARTDGFHVIADCGVQRRPCR